MRITSLWPLQACTQWDALSHVYYEDKLYNGFPANSVTSQGATKNSIHAVGAAGGIVFSGSSAGRGSAIEASASSTGGAFDRTPKSSMKLPKRIMSKLAEAMWFLIRIGWWNQFYKTGVGTASWQWRELAHRGMASQARKSPQSPRITMRWKASTSGIRMRHSFRFTSSLSVTWACTWASCLNSRHYQRDCADDGRL